MGPFYPAGTKPHDFLSFYSRAFGTVEVDSTYHATPGEHVVRGWAERVPARFSFALKLPRELTPEAQAPDAGQLALFCERARLLGDKLGPVLVQLGPEFGPDRWHTVGAFLARLPAGLRWAVEFRQRGWVGPKLLDLLHRHGVALVLVEGRWLEREKMIDLAIRPTADFAYVRWMGGGKRIEDRDRELSIGPRRARGARVDSVRLLQQSLPGARAGEREGDAATHRGESCGAGAAPIPDQPFLIIVGAQHAAPLHGPRVLRSLTPCA